MNQQHVYNVIILKNPFISSNKLTTKFLEKYQCLKKLRLLECEERNKRKFCAPDFDLI